nr:hypothetical protein [Tanacetum cinerariifolium]
AIASPKASRSSSKAKASSKTFGAKIPPTMTCAEKKKGKRKIIVASVLKEGPSIQGLLDWLDITLLRNIYRIHTFQPQTRITQTRIALMRIPFMNLTLQFISLQLKLAFASCNLQLVIKACICKLQANILQLAFASKHLQLAIVASNCSLHLHLAIAACICILQLHLAITACICRLLTYFLALAVTKLTHLPALAACKSKLKLAFDSCNLQLAIEACICILNITLKH